MGVGGGGGGGGVGVRQGLSGKGCGQKLELVG